MSTICPTCGKPAGCLEAMQWPFPAPPVAPTSQDTAAQIDAARCTSCDGTGDLIRADGEYLGRCICTAGKVEAAHSPPGPADNSQQGEPVAWIAPVELNNHSAARRYGAKFNGLVWSEPTGSAGIPLYTHPSSPQVAVADGRPDAAQAYIVKFDDTDRDDVLFYGEFAERAALEFFDQSQVNWSCYLFRCIAGPSPRANPAAPQSAPKAVEPQEDSTWVNDGTGGYTRSVFAKSEPQARHWRDAIRDWFISTRDGHWLDWIEQRARSLAQAEQAAQSDGHASDCSVHNEPAYPNGPCDCGAEQAAKGDK